MDISTILVKDFKKIGMISHAYHNIKNMKFQRQTFNIYFDININMIFECTMYVITTENTHIVDERGKTKSYF